MLRRYDDELDAAFEEAAQAIQIAEPLLADQERVLGPHHPATLVSRNNLAAIYQEAGRVAEAIPLFESTLADMERVLGPDHPHTLASRNNLAAAKKSLRLYLSAPGHPGFQSRP